MSVRLSVCCRNVESVNAEVTQDFRGSYTASQNAFRRDLVSTLTAHTTTLSTTTTQHCERVRGCLRAVTDSSRTLTTLGQQQANLTTQTINLVNTMVEAMVRGVEEARVEGRRDAATLGHTLATLLASGRDTLDHLGANISASTTTLATHHSQVKQKVGVCLYVLDGCVFVCVRWLCVFMC
ncbi:hypothetical protein GWK47_009131 [Chionoecetes opilio]|uniref:Uncharacterized protein n=1 Tax=Chionoecetes opilio TaxID=41210 RepID=A0A8J4XZA9_CHIOP|nr:hypothetical protein GWK47_009131 [Chionoecetes opilio]